MAPVALADPDAAHPWDATWVGGFDNGGDGVQVIVAGDAVVGFFLGGDYVDVSETAAIAADGSLTFTWDGGTATLGGRDDGRTLTIHAKGVADRVVKVTEDK
jgi:hypothetical protein